MSYRFDDVEIDAAGFRVIKAGQAVRLEPKAVELLLFLAENPGRLVTKAEIQAAVWKDTFVTESALTRLVAQIRRALGDGAREARYIETVPTRGYRFVARLEPAQRGAGDPAPAPAAAGPVDDGRERRPARARALLLAGVAVVALSAAGLAAWRWAAGQRTSAVAPPGADPRPVATQVSTGAGLNIAPSFSPDGASLAYSSLRDGVLQVVVRGLAAGSRELAITSDRAQNVQPAFSPDGRLLAFHSVARGGLWIVPALGGVPRQLTRFGSCPSWSPDGAMIAFQGQSWAGAAEGNFAAGEGSTLWTVPSEGGEPRPLTTISDVGPGGQGAPSWSPDGRLVAFLAGARVMVVRSDGSRLRRVHGSAFGAGEVWATGVAWERTGRAQIWTGSLGGNWYAWRVPVSPETGEQAGPPEVIAGGGESGWSQPTVSRDGRSLAYVTFRTRFELQEQPVDAVGRASGPPRSLVPDVAGRKVPLGFSPDGRRFAFGTMRPGIGRSLWVVDVATHETKLVAEQAGVAWVRGFFPDGHTLACIRGEGREAALWTVDADTGETRLKTTVPAYVDWPPLLSPDGRYVAAHGTRGGGLNVFTVELATGSVRQASDDTVGAGWPVWSPDGTRLAVELMRGGDTHVGLLPSAGGAIRTLVSAPGQSWPQSFSPDGRRVAYAGQRLGVWNVYWAPVEGGAEQRVTDYSTPAVYVRYPFWSPRGGSLVYEQAESVSTVWVSDLPSQR